MQGNATDILRSSWKPLWTEGIEILWTTSPLQLLCWCCIAILSWQVYAATRIQHVHKFPLVNKRRPWELIDLRVRAAFYLTGDRTLKKALRELPGKVFLMWGDTGLVTILPPEYADDVKNNSAKMDFGKIVSKPLIHVPAYTMQPIPQECGLAMRDIFPDTRAWQKIAIKKKVALLVARLASRVFLGEAVCRNPVWLNIAVSHIMTGFIASSCLRIFPSFSRPFVHWFVPHCRRLRAHVADARSIVRAEVERRKSDKEACARDGKTYEEPNDGITWCAELAKEHKFNVVDMQLGLSIASTHNTTDLITQVIYDIAREAELVQRLRQEAIEVIRKGGWSKASLYNLKLLDSVIKESQRLKPISTLAMRRVVTSDVTLSDGTFLSEGTVLGVSAHRQWDDAVYANAREFVGDRFLRMRQEPGKDNVAQLVTTGIDHLAFGYGAHACPGRFFAAAEMKIILVYVLLNYDFRIIAGAEPKVQVVGFALDSDPTAELEIRSRDAELDLLNMEWKFLFLHPLRHYPGPRLWAASRIPYAYQCAKGTAHTRLLELHQKYGDVVRVAPDELSFSTSQAWKELLGRRKNAIGENGKDRIHYAEGLDSVLGAPKDKHARFRRILTQGFSNRAMLEQEAIIKGHIDNLFNKLHELCHHGPIDMTKWFEFVALDIITDLGFGESFHCLHTGRHHAWAQIFTDSLRGLAFAMAIKRFPWLFSALEFLSPKALKQKYEENVEYTNGMVLRRLAETDRPDFIRALAAKDDENPLTIKEIQNNAQILTMAGYDTTATALAGVVYLITSHPNVLTRLNREVRSSFQNEGEIGVLTTQNLTYLAAVVNESLRVYPPAASGAPRQVPVGGDIIFGEFVPEGVSAIYRD
ncbi:hypothetical protein F66182_6941 [Fusarium sp. NRRL 66182]|nr:hypothetical protein F66182_6941 [Fusarium sp. NRRL 66182]